MLRNDGIGGTPRLARYTSLGVAAAPGSTQRGNKINRSRLDAAILKRARKIVTTHLPTRFGECRVCDSAAFCEPFNRAMAVLDRWEPAKARRIRAVLQYAGLWPVAGASDEEASDGA
ncbi:hypothetical protein O7632_09540 [Solwaraspora sp. WMMD406]|uniref:hypothetical protein n=1 Tax=Solwaraspora sp. WMMD406 TaxID=3016095 RepID=UPI002416267D|nr:hypothetical protein [Solwaraspora sp. WMMD406]MDG4764343.1 hypothetical protein [Solwaraspora sp. WMMD406]